METIMDPDKVEALNILFYKLSEDLKRASFVSRFSLYTGEEKVRLIKRFIDALECLGYRKPKIDPLITDLFKPHQSIWAATILRSVESGEKDGGVKTGDLREAVLEKIREACLKEVDISRKEIEDQFVEEYGRRIRPFVGEEINFLAEKGIIILNMEEKREKQRLRIA